MRPKEAIKWGGAGEATLHIEDKSDITSNRNFRRK